MRWCAGRRGSRVSVLAADSEKPLTPATVGAAPGRWRPRKWAVRLRRTSGPAQDKPLEDLGRVDRWVGAEEGLRMQGTPGVLYQHPADGHRRLACAIPDGGLGGEFHGTGSVAVPGHSGYGPRHVGLIQDGFQRWSPVVLQGGPAVVTRRTRRRWRVECCVQAQFGDKGNGLAQGLAAVEQVQDSVAIVPHQRQGSVGQPAWFGRLTMSGVA